MRRSPPTDRRYALEVRYSQPCTPASSPARLSTLTPMLPSRAIELVRRHLAANGFRNVAVEISARARRKAGSAHWHRGKPHKLVLAAWLVERAPDEEIEDTILHEIAHLIAGNSAGHGPRWRAAARRLGCSDERCYRGDLARYAPPARWEGTCAGDCGTEWSRYRLTSRIRKFGICPKCGVKIRWVLAA